MSAELRSPEGHTTDTFSGRPWQLRPVDERRIQEIIQRFSVREPIARLLTAREIPIHDIENFLNPTIKALLPNPDHLKDMAEAVAVFMRHLEADHTIALFGDYDVDGATSTAVLVRFLRSLGVAPYVYIPDRHKEGYGPNSAAFNGLADQGVSLIITMDCGSMAFEPMAAAKARGVDVIILDHHIAPPKHPDNAAFINPNRFDETSPERHLAAVGVTFLFVVALHAALKKQGFYEARGLPHPDLMSLLDLVALGTVCDMVPLKGVNRAFVRQGLKVMASRQNLGLKTLADAIPLQEPPTPYHLGFLFGPRINAGGRVGRSDLGVRLLTTEDPGEAAALAQELDALNRARQTIEKAVLEAAMREAEGALERSPDRRMLILHQPDWHIGVIGIVAGRIKEMFNLPTWVIGRDETGVGKGSGRSVTGLDLGTLVQQATLKGILMGGGGHAMAAGLTVDLARLGELEAFFEAALADHPLDTRPIQWVDAFLTPAGAISIAPQLSQLEPFGMGMPTPRFALQEVVSSGATVVGEGHVKCTVKSVTGGSGLAAIAFRAQGTPLGDALLGQDGRPLDLLGTIRMNHWMGRTTPQWTIEDGAFSKGV